MNRITRAVTDGSRTRRAAKAGALAAVLAVALPIAACDDFLTVEDPDIINPSDIQSPQGAEAARNGALARFNVATSGGESLFLLGGLFADEWNNGDSFIARQEIDQRTITAENSFLTTANRALHRARLSAEQAADLLKRYSPNAPTWQIAEMEFIQAYIINLMAEHYCDGLILSTVVDGREQFGHPMTTVEAYERALSIANAGLDRISETSAEAALIRYALQVTKGRILLNLDRAAEAAQAVNGVPTDFKYFVRHSPNTTTNAIWQLNNRDRRYSVSDREGINGLDFATANDPRVPVCQGGTPECAAVGVTDPRRDDRSAEPLYVQMIWTTETSPVVVVDGIEARLIEAEAQLREGNSAWLTTLNDLRATVGLGPLPDPGNEIARQDLLFRERAFWFFGRGHRVGDLRRLVRQYGRSPETVFPVGAWHKGGNYGTDVTLPIPQAEENNPNAPRGQLCMNRNA